MTLHAERLRTRCRLVVPRRSIRPVSSPTQITEWGTPPSPLALTFAPAPLCAWMSRRMYHPRDCHAHARSHCQRLGFGAVFRLIQLEEVEKPGFGGVSAAPDLGPSGQEPSPSHPSCAGCGASTALAVPATSSDAWITRPPFTARVHAVAYLCCCGPFMPSSPARAYPRALSLALRVLYVRWTERGIYVGRSST